MSLYTLYNQQSANILITIVIYCPPVIKMFTILLYILFIVYIQLYYYRLTINRCELISSGGSLYFTSLSLNKKSNKTLEFHVVWFIEESRTQRNARIKCQQVHFQESIFETFFRYLEEKRIEIDPGHNSHWRHRNHFTLCIFSHVYVLFLQQYY